MEEKSLKDLMNEELLRLNCQDKFRSLDLFIKDDDLCAAFIRNLLNDEDYQVPGEKDVNYDLAKARARHSVITFLMGKVFSRFYGIYNGISQGFHPQSSKHREALNQRLWLLTALYHDYGYHSAYINQDVELKGIAPRYLLTDEYKEGVLLSSLHDFSSRFQGMMAYTYEEIEKYDQYAREYHRKMGDKEKVDHGILGAVLKFHRLSSKADQRSTRVSEELQVLKASCMTIAQHNIFKSGKAEWDEGYRKHSPVLDKLYHDSDFRIDRRTPLLLLLCLVDTIECVKKFSKGSSDNEYLETDTVLSEIKVAVSEDKLVINYLPLRDRIRKSKKEPEKLEKILNAHISALSGFHTWTVIHAKTVDESKLCVEITI